MLPETPTVAPPATGGGGTGKGVRTTPITTPTPPTTGGGITNVDTSNTNDY